MAAIISNYSCLFRYLRIAGRYASIIAVTSCGGSGGDTATLPTPQNITPSATYYTGTLHRDAGRTVLSLEYGLNATFAAGPDQQYFTGDDALQSYSLDSVDVTGTRRTRSTTMAAGKDNLLFTADDNTGYYEIVETDSNGRNVRTLYFSSSGPDQIAFTADDELSMYDALQDDGRLSFIFVSPGGDGVWLTSDDVRGNRYTRIEPNNTTRFQKRTQYESGPDGVVGTDDDILCLISQTWDLGEGAWEQAVISMDRCGLVTGSGPHGGVSAFDAAGRSLRELILESPGDDGIWLTTDDFKNLQLTLDNKDFQTLYYVFASNGSISYILDDQFDPNNRNNFRSVNHIAPGADRAWLTPDDTIGGYLTQREDLVSSTLTKRTTGEYSGAGTDNVWNTPDDVLSSVVINVIGTE